MSVSIDVVQLTRLDEMAEAVDLQRTFWGNDAESIVAAHVMFSIVNCGGHILAAKDGEHLIGILIGMIGIEPQIGSEPHPIFVLSKRMVVSADYRNHGLGYTLKMAQRDLALSQGIQRVIWTFDPLLSPNAHLNLRKLGAISRTYKQDYYGKNDQSGLSTLGSSDRWYVEWHLLDEDVQARAQGVFKPLSLAQYLDGGAPILNPKALDSDDIPELTENLTHMQPYPKVLVEIPANYPHITATATELGHAWRMHTRDIFKALLDKGYVASDLVSATEDGQRRVFYVLKLPA